MEQVMSHALTACPFLASLVEREGTHFAANFALNPTQPASSSRGPVLEDWDAYSFQRTFSLFHGPQSAVPLARACPQMLETQPTASVSAGDVVSRRASRPSSIAQAPLAVMSLGAFGNMPDFGKLLRSLQQQHKRKPPSNRPADHQPRNPTQANSSATTSPASSGTSSANANGATCPMRKLMGPLAPLVFNPKGHLQCPEAIIKARAALAATKPVKELRPQALPIKLLAVGGVTAAVNVPCGMWREHCEKFSGSWFVAVHASIPFIAMLRKAVIMPKYAILFTIATAIAGQAMGAKLERRRLGPRRLTTSRASSAALTQVSTISAAPALQITSSYRWGQASKHCLVKTKSGHAGAVRSPLAHGEHHRALVPVQ